MAYKLILNTGRKDIIDVYKVELARGVLLRSDAQVTLNTVYDEQALQSLTTTQFLRMIKFQFANNNNEYIVLNNVQQSGDDNIFMNYVPAGTNANKVGLFEKEVSGDYRLNGLINITEIAPSSDIPVLINLNIKVLDNL